MNKRLCQEDCKDIDMVLIIKVNLEDFRIITDLMEILNAKNNT